MMAGRDPADTASRAVVGVVRAVAWLAFAWLLAPTVLVLVWLTAVAVGQPGGVWAAGLGIGWLALLFAPRLLRRHRH